MPTKEMDNFVDWYARVCGRARQEEYICETWRGIGQGLVAFAILCIVLAAIAIVAMWRDPEFRKYDFCIHSGARTVSPYCDNRLKKTGR